MVRPETVRPLALQPSNCSSFRNFMQTSGMKQLVAGIIFLAFALESKAQYPKLIVEFTNKAGTPYGFNAASQFLSQRAINRRNRYHISMDSADLPVSPTYINTVLAQGPVTLLSRSKWLNQVLIQCTDATTITKIQALPFVKTVRGIGYKPGFTPPSFTETITPLPGELAGKKAATDTFDYGNSYNQVHIHEGEFLHNKGFTGEGMLIAVLDAGFNSYKTITAFDSTRQKGRIIGERDFVTFDNSVNEDDAHGMFVLSTMAANWPGKMVGTAPRASFWLLRTENAATEYPIEEHNWVVGAEFADSAGADMISSSLGYNTFDDASFDHNYPDFYKNRTMVSKGATTAAQKGLIVMNSAGNEGNSSWKYLVFPADSDSVCAVAAVTQAGTVASFSSYGYPGKVKPNIASVGAGTVLAGFSNSPVTGNGTSYANPNIAGLIACLWQAFPEFNNMQILDAVYRSCPTYNTPNDRIGFGIPNMKIAYNLLEQQRAAMFSNSWLKASPVPFSKLSELEIRFRAPESGKAFLRLIDAGGRLIEMMELTTTQNDFYNVRFSNSYALSRGVYFVQYVGAKEKQTVKVLKGGN